MQYLQPSHLYTRLIDTIPTSLPLPWSSDPAVKGDPKKSVKWIDVCFLKTVSAYDTKRV